MPTAILPEIKLSKVGKDRKRDKKRAGLGWLAESGNSGSAIYAAGTQSAGRGVLGLLQRVLGQKLFLLLPKLLVAALVPSMAIGAYSVGRLVKRQAVMQATRHDDKPQVFATKEGAAAAAAADAELAKGGDSVGLLMREARDGKTDAQRAEEAAAAAKAQAEADAKATAAAAAADAKAQADAAAAAGAGPAAGNAGVADLIAAQTGQLGQNKSPLSGFKSKAAGDSGASGSGLTGWGFGEKMGIGGRLAVKGAPTGMSQGLVAAQPAPRMSSRAGRVNGKGRGLGFNQLNRATQLSASAVKSNVNETASQDATNAFQPPVGGDTALAGAPGGSNAASGGGTSSSGGGSGGGSDPQNPNATVDTSGLGMCDSVFPSGGFVSSPGGGCVCPPGQDSTGGSCSSVAHTNATPWQPLVNAAKALTMTVAALLAVATALGVMANMISLAPPAAAIVRMAAMWLCGIAALLSAIVLMLGISIGGYGGEAGPEGKLFVIMGGIMTAVAAVAWYNYESTDVNDWVDNAADYVTQAAPGTYTSVAATPIMVAGGGALAGGATAAQ